MFFQTLRRFSKQAISAGQRFIDTVTLKINAKLNKKHGRTMKKLPKGVVVAMVVLVVCFVVRVAVNFALMEPGFLRTVVAWTFGVAGVAVVGDLFVG